MPELFLEQAKRHRHYRMPSFYTHDDIRAILGAIEGCRWHRDEIDLATSHAVLRQNTDRLSNQEFNVGSI